MSAAAPGGWALALTARALLAVDPAGLGGLVLRARAGPARERFLDGLAEDLAPLALRRIAPGIGDEALFGGLDLAATLAAGRPVQGRGLLGGGPVVLLLAGAERSGAALAGRLAPWLDAGCGTMVALDEAAGDEPGTPPALALRLGLHVSLEGIAHGGCSEQGPGPAAIRTARARLAGVVTPPDAAERLVGLAGALGIGDLRAPLFALRAARAAAALAGAARVDASAEELAVAVVLLPRATCLPAPPAETEPEPEPPPPEDREAAGREDGPGDTPPPERVLEAARALLPPGLLERLVGARAARVSGGTSAGGTRRRGNRRGRPLPARPGRPHAGARVDLVATLRAAAPWQGLRQGGARGALVRIRASDIHLARREEQSDRVLIFLVDASGSTAAARLAEAKGAIEILLAEAYARRDHVALIAFRGRGAEVLLPPTRSLVQTRRRLAALPGGGGTPLAAGLEAAGQLAALCRARGMAPALVALTDGRGNIARDGRPDRAAAADDAAALGRTLAAAGLPALVIDTGPRPRPEAAALARALGAACLPLPRADARGLSAAVSAGLGG